MIRTRRRSNVKRSEAKAKSNRMGSVWLRGIRGEDRRREWDAAQASDAHIVNGVAMGAECQPVRGIRTWRREG
jgi:hypothetical protein